MSFDKWIDPFNHPISQNIQHFHLPKKLSSALCISFPPAPGSIWLHLHSRLIIHQISLGVSAPVLWSSFPASHCHALSCHKQWPTLFSVPPMLFLPTLSLSLIKEVSLDTSDLMESSNYNLATHQVTLLYWHCHIFTFYHVIPISHSTNNYKNDE